MAITLTNSNNAPIDIKIKKYKKLFLRFITTDLIIENIDYFLKFYYSSRWN